MDKVIKSANEASEQIIEWGESHGFETCFERAERLKPCPIGATGACCKICHVGPCRLVGPNAEEEARGVCGATLPTISARNILRNAAAGTAAHSDHARDMAFTLLAVANGETKDFQIKDERKLYKVAGILGIEFGNGRSVKDVARDVAIKLLDDFGRQKGEINYIKRATEKTQERWRKWGIVPRGIDREIAEAMHRTNMGVDHDPDNLLLSALRVSLADGWGGCMISTDISDILFGTPQPVKAEASFGIFKEDEVNLVVHGHEPSLAEMIVEVVNEPELIAYAKSKGAKGINLGGMCCTANEVLMRHGIPTAGGFTNQELGIMTGLVDAISVDVQCIMPAIAEISKKLHTKVITTSPKAMITGAVRVEYDEHRAREVAREIVRIAIDNFPNRKKAGSHVTEKFPVIAGFSHEYIEYMQGGRWRASFRPLNDAIMAGRIRGVVGLAGCDNPRVPATGIHKFLAMELIKNDVLIVSTGCGSAACGTAGYLTPAMAEEGGLSDEIGGMPAVGIAPEWMSEKAIAIGCYFAASGVPVIFGGESPVEASQEVTRIMTEVWFERFRGVLRFEPDPEKILDLTLNYIDSARDALKLRKYEPGRFGMERVLLDMAARRELEKAVKPHLGIY